MVLTFEFLNEILQCDHSDESYRVVLSSGAVYYAIRMILTFESVDEILSCAVARETATIEKPNRRLARLFILL